MQDSIVLLEMLVKYQDPETAVAVYKEASGYIDAFERVKDIAKGFIKNHLFETGELELTTRAGKVVYTSPKTPRLNADAWRAATVARPELRTLQQQFDAARDALDLAQAPFKELPAPTLRIS